MKKEKTMLLIKIAIPVFILGVGFGADRYLTLQGKASMDNPIVVSADSSALTDKPLEIVSKQCYENVEGFSENLGFINDDEAVVGVGLTSTEFNKKYPNKIDTNDNDAMDKAHDDFYGYLYKIKLSTMEKAPLNIKTLNSAVLSNMSKVSFVKDNNFLIYDLNNASNNICENADINSIKMNGGDWSEDGNCYMTYSENGDLDVYNVKTKSLKKLKVKSKNFWITSTRGFYSENGENIYFLATQNKDGDLKYQRQGIFKINSSENMNEVLVLPFHDPLNKDSKVSSINDFCVLDGGRKILLDGSIEGQYGDFIYDSETKKFYNVVAHTAVSKEGAYASPFWVSPDKTKVIFMNLEVINGKDQWNLYAAKLNRNTFSDKICLYKDVNLSNSLDVKWSKDSKKILFFTGVNPIKGNNYIFNEKNQVNIITFK